MSSEVSIQGSPGGGFRFVVLDALRGIASVIVVIAHTTIIGLYNVEPYWSLLKWTPLRIFWSGHQAVILFFVLSGFALSCMLENMRGKNYFVYVSRRIVRLYPPYLASLAVALSIFFILSCFMGEWKNDWPWLPDGKVSLKTIFDHFLMIGEFNVTSINPPIWSLVHEMRISIIFPLFFAFTKKNMLFAVCVFLTYSFIFGFIHWNGNRYNLDLLYQNMLLTVHYGTFFVIGSIIWCKKQSIILFFRKFSKSVRIVLWVIFILMYAYPFDNPWTFGQRIVGDIFIGVGASGIISMILSSEIPLAGKVGRFLGDISYSLYLNHYVVLGISIIVFYSVLPNFALWALTLCGSLLMAFIMSCTIENYSKKLSRKIGN